MQEEVKEAIVETLKEETQSTQEEIQKPIEQKVEERKVEEEIEEHPNIRRPISIPKPVTKPSNKNNDQKQLTTTQGLEKTPIYDTVWDFFNENKIDVIEESQISKDREREFVVTVPSALGFVKYYVRARNKKKLNEGDVAPALLKAKQKDLQCLFLTNGEFTKKSLAIIDKEYSGILIKTF